MTDRAPLERAIFFGAARKFAVDCNLSVAELSLSIGKSGIKPLSAVFCSPSGQFLFVRRASA
jgi:hypothetical protein